MSDSEPKCRGNRMAKELILLCVLLVYTPVESSNLLEEIRKKPMLSKAAGIIDGDTLLSTLIAFQSYTAFIPTNKALDAYTGQKDRILIQYHMVNLPYLVQNLPNELNTDLPGNPRLYVTKIPSGAAAIKGYEDFHTYINNAKITDGNHEATSNDGHKQYLHIVDQVIAPTYPHTSPGVVIPTEFLYPDAQKLLLKPQLYGLEGDFSISEFEKRVSSLNLFGVFNMTGKNTFFIPTDQALNPPETKDVLDKQVVHGHVIPNKVLFTRTVASSTLQHESLAFTDNLKVFISMENVTSPDTNEMFYYVKSNTVAGDISHKKGTVLARIPRGNIPVKNGVVHLIDRPLMIVASSIISYIQETKGQLTMFYNLIRDHNVDMSHTLLVNQDLTLFAPSNEAFRMVNNERLQQMIYNQEKLKKLLKLHIVHGRLTTDEIVTRTKIKEETMNPGRMLYFAVNDESAPVPVVSLEGGGVNATITTPNIAAKNGVIHIIDRILGIPSQTVYEKLQSDPMLSTTFNLSNQDNWNARLKSRDERFTLFVPSNDAWELIHRNMASAYKKLFMGGYAYHGRLILERHMIAGQDLNLEELIVLTTNSTIPNLHQKSLEMTRGKIYFQARIRNNFGESTEANDTDSEFKSPEEDYTLEWNGISARVIRPDVECVNGVVHVIDRVLMMKRDVTVSGSSVPAATGLATLVATFVTIAFARALHR